MYIQEELFPPAAPAAAGATADRQAGAVYTGHDAVCFMLDVAGYRETARLFHHTILEPSFGGGSFLLEIIRRLMRSCDTFGYGNHVSLEPCIRAVELDERVFRSTRAQAEELLVGCGVLPETARFLLSKWLLNTDFLLWSTPAKFDYVVGNPPYVRLEHMDKGLHGLYKETYATWTDRADIYIPFFEKGLRVMSDRGKLVYLCSNRWMKNRYGKRLRQFVLENYSVDYVIDISSPDLFDKKVTAYPAITLISRKRAGGSAVHYSSYSGSCKKMYKSLETGYKVVLNREGVPPDAAWIWETADDSVFHAGISTRFPRLEDCGCKVGIGVATGADKVFINRIGGLPVEEDRILPLAMSRDVSSGGLHWGGMGVVNPYDTDGRLIRLEEYPALSAYLHRHKAVLENRHCARKSPGAWYRTIDKIHLPLAKLPKILVPDIKGELMPVVDEGGLYPHHNLYYILPGPWDIHALRAFLMSDFCQWQLRRCCTVMNGGALRCQAQFLRQLRLPPYADISPDDRVRLCEAGARGDRAYCNMLVDRILGEILQEDYEHVY